VDINQVYRAPSIPKLGKKTVSSSVLRGAAATTAAAPKLGKTRFSFLKPKISAENLKTDVSSVSVEQSLAETNRILVEIQKQLSLDFANRIAEEKELLKNVKKAESKRKFAAREKFAEGTRKISGAVGGVVDKVSAPIKSVFDKIKEFFGLILTGIVVNKAFDWLQKEENRQKLDRIFNFVGKYWKEITGAIVGIQLATTIASLAGTIGIIAGILTNPVFLVAAGAIAFMAATKKISEMQSKQREKEIAEMEKRTGEPVSEEKKKVLEERDLQLRTNLGGSEGALGIYFSSWLRGLRRSEGGTIPSTSYNFNPDAIQKFSGGGSVRGYAEGGTFWERLTGTVRGSGSMMVDSVKALLAPGEEIIRATSAMLFRPLLKDINDNAGRLWVTFSKAILKLLSVNDAMLKRSNEFAKVIEEFDQYLKDETSKKQRENQYNIPNPYAPILAGPGPGSMPSRSQNISSSSKSPRISGAPKITNVAMAAPSSGGMTLLPMVLPTQKSKPPEIPQMQGKATEVPVISPVDFSNPWMDISPEWYGIQLYG
jgi:hypothetical protein